VTTAHRQGLVSRVVGWLRAGYPEGVPAQDYVALLGILQRVLTPAEVDRVVAELAREADAGDEILTRALVEQRIEDVVKGAPVPEDISRVSARLAAAGWPLWSSGADEPDAAPDGNGKGAADVRPGLVSKIVGWLREGYPTTMPAQDYIPLLALLRRRLTDAEVAQVSGQLAEHGALPPDRADIGAAITKVTEELPSEDDLGRVRDYLVQHGWPVDFSL
jgi:hypothetical protein